MIKDDLATMICDGDRVTASFDEIELRGGKLIVGCKCTRNDGMQHECQRAKCMGRSPCLAHPVPMCRPSRPCQPIANPSKTKTKTRPPLNIRSVEAVSRGDTSVTDPVVAAERARRQRCRRAAARRAFKYATDHYDDRPAFKTLFKPCRVHAIPLPDGDKFEKTVVRN